MGEFETVMQTRDPVEGFVNVENALKLPFSHNGTVPKAPNTIGTTLVFTSHILLNSLARF